MVDVPLLSVGLDSLSAAEFSTLLSSYLKTELPPTLIFDHPSLRSIAETLTAEVEVW